MIQDWQDLINNMNVGVKMLRQGAPDVMKSFGDMAKAAHGGGALEGKTKELIALALGVSTRCAPCIAYHAEGAAKLGASREGSAGGDGDGDLYGRGSLRDVCRAGAGGF